jgi:aconitate hydratase
VIAESFERIHRSNLVGMGILPLEFARGENLQSLGLTGREQFTIRGVDALQPGQTVEVEAKAEAGESTIFRTHARVDNNTDRAYVHHGGILPLVLRELVAQ